jgi:2,3-bisphosphoglycerate-independent phosphoglycerate mutase
MVGHTGNLVAATTAIEVVDDCLGRLGNLLISLDGTLVITSDHGNVENMLNTEHDPNPVPLIVVSKRFPETVKLSPGSLCDVSPTILDILKIPKPKSMSGQSLILPNTPK